MAERARFQELGVQWGVPDAPTLLTSLIKHSGILQTAVAKPSNFGNQHKYKFHNALPLGTFREFGSGIVPQIVANSMATIDLWDIVSLAQDDAEFIESYPGGKDGWIEANLPAFIEGLGQTLASQIIYGTIDTSSLTGGGKNSTVGFQGLFQYAKAMNQIHKAVQSPSGNTTSIYAVRWDETDGVQLRLGGSSRTGTDLIQIKDITPANPALVVQNTNTNAQLPVYSWMIHCLVTLVVPTIKSVSVLYCVDDTVIGSASALSQFAKDLNTIVEEIDATNGQKFIYANVKGKSLISGLKQDKLTLYRADMDYNNLIESYRGVPIILEENILSTETSSIPA